MGLFLTDVVTLSVECRFCWQIYSWGCSAAWKLNRSLIVLSAAAKADSELFKYVEYYDFAYFHGDMKPGLDRAEGAVVELVGIDLANHWCCE